MNLPAWSIATWPQFGSAAIAKAIRTGRFLAGSWPSVATTTSRPASSPTGSSTCSLGGPSGGVFGDRRSNSNLLLPAPRVDHVCASSLSERSTRPGSTPAFSPPGGTASGRLLARLAQFGRRNEWRISPYRDASRLSRRGHRQCVAEAVADVHRAQGLRLRVTASHPALIAHCSRSPSGGHASRENRLAKRRPFRETLSRLDRPGRGVLRILGMPTGPRPA